MRIFISLLAAGLAIHAQAPVPLFDSHGDLGANPLKGSLVYDSDSNRYKVTGGGANIWGTEDALYFVWKRVTGDVTLTANVAFEGQGVNEHRKAVLMIRQDMSPGAAYADIALHGDGLTSLQYRPAAGGPTLEMKSAVAGPNRLRIERRGNAFTAYAAKGGQQFEKTGPQTVELSGPVYVGIGVCSHDAKVLETAVFSGVQFEEFNAPAAAPAYRSHITIYDLTARSSRTVYSGDGIIEAPNWSRDGSFLLVNTGGNLYRLPLKGADARLEKIELGGGYRANNDHDLSRDGKLLAFSASSPASRQSKVYAANADGTGVRLLTPAAPSYFHGWSPDSKWLAFVGQRNGKYELYRVPVGGGPEERLTSKGAYDDGPEYSPDGKWIYFNSDRSGGWDVWRIPSSGGGAGDEKAERVTSDDGEDWFPHISPDFKHMIFLSFPAGTKGHNGRMPGVALRMMPAPGSKLKPGARIETLTTFFGGQGTLNVNSWSPDSKQFAYVVYEEVAPPPVVELWPAGAPGSEGRFAGEVTRLVNGERVVSSVHRPSVTVYLPAKDKAAGAAVVIAPGGGHREMWTDHEGHNIARWLASHGVAGFVLKYRLAREKDSTYSVERESFADIQRAIRLLRHRASEWGLQPDRIGVMGFSAGGELAALAGTRYDAGNAGASDAVERQSSRPAFQALIYPAIPREMPVTKETPPAFLVCGENDRRNISQGLPELYLAFKRAEASAELHVYAGVGHGFGLRDRTRGAVGAWVERFHEWLGARGLR